MIARWSFAVLIIILTAWLYWLTYQVGQLLNLAEQIVDRDYRPLPERAELVAVQPEPAPKPKPRPTPTPAEPATRPLAMPAPQQPDTRPAPAVIADGWADLDQQYRDAMAAITAIGKDRE